MNQEKKMVVVTLNGTAYSCPAGTTLGDLMQGHGHGNMPCGGHGKCGKCRVTVKGEVTPPTEDERKALTAEELTEGIRLACRTRVLGNCTVTTAEQSGGQIVTDGEFPSSMKHGALNPFRSGYGAAIDIGTTTLAARLYDREGRIVAGASRLNPQSVWGADVISRMEAAMAGNASKMAAQTRRTLDDMLAELAKTAGVQSRDIGAVTITGNTVMLHLLTETDVEPLTHAPFEAKRLFGETLPASHLDLTRLDPDAPVYLPPCIAAFVGADTVTAILASDIRESPETALLCDIGTNGEMVLWHENTLYACSTAAGPAFEGAGISMGMGGRTGAVDRVWVTDGRIDAHVIGEAAPTGICGSGLVDAVAALLDTEELDETGFLEDDPAVIADPVEITQEDIRAVQLAKSAIHAGMRTLIETAGLSCDEVTTLYIAGGFGSYLDVKNAGKIGLLPEELTDRVTVLGNAALTGAAMLLLCPDLRPACESMARETRIVELATNPVFVSEYMERMMF
ncbi:MAG: DUF4445 domain-containing protein [Ruminococcaceae bacterium]|nr:DUF4445 domain-containing protein [Oscillospiraceae bacterium]